MKCPNCNSHALQTERRPDGNTKCLKCGYEARTAKFEVKVTKNKSRIRHTSFSSNFNTDPLGDSTMLSDIDFNLNIKVEFMRADGEDKYKLLKELKDAVDLVRSRWS